MKDKSCGNKIKRRNNEGKHKQPLSDLERAKKQFQMIVERFEAGHYEDLEEAYDMIEDMQNLEVIIEERSYRVL